MFSDLIISTPSPELIIEVQTAAFTTWGVAMRALLDEKGLMSYVSRITSHRRIFYTKERNPEETEKFVTDYDTCLKLILISLPLSLQRIADQAIDAAGGEMEDLTGLLDVCQTALDTIAALPVSPTFLVSRFSV
jgi:hypothetical protein